MYKTYILNDTQINYESIAEHCNLWRNYDDIDDSWDSMMKIVDYFAQKQEFWAQYAGPGHWNDPDMVSNHILTQVYMSRVNKITRKIIFF